MFTSHVFGLLCIGLRSSFLSFSGDDSEIEYPSDVDPYDYLGYGTDFEECADEFDE